MSSTTQLDEAATWIAELRPQDLPEDIRSLGRLQVIDTIGAICGGSRSLVGQRLRQAIERIATPGPCTVLPDGTRWSVSDVVYLHSALANALELDNFVLSGHFGQSSVAVGLALGEMTAATWDEVVTAQIAGLEVATRLGAYISAGPHHGQMRAYAHRVAAATCAAHLLGLDRDKTVQALAIALAAPEFPMFPAAFSPDTKAVLSSSPTVEGLRAAFLAEAGLDAATEIVDDPLGLVGMFTYMDGLPRVWSRLGRSWFIHSLSTKTQATCAYAQGPVTCAVRIREEEGVDPDEIERVVVRAPVTAVVMEAFSRPHRGAGVTPVNTHFSTRRSVAAALRFGRLVPELFDSGFEARAPLIAGLSERIELHHSWSMTVDLLRGVDAGLQGAGRPGIYGMGQSHRTLDRFKDLVGSRPLLSWRDAGGLARLPATDRSYLLRRYWRGYRARLPFRGGASARRGYRSWEDDMSRLTMRLAGRLQVTLRSGRVLAAECRVPPGFAGDPDRSRRMRDKFVRECRATLGPEADRMLSTIEGADGQTRFSSIFDALRPTSEETGCRGTRRF